MDTQSAAGVRDAYAAEHDPPIERHTAWVASSRERLARVWRTVGNEAEYDGHDAD